MNTTYTMTFICQPPAGGPAFDLKIELSPTDTAFNALRNAENALAKTHPGATIIGARKIETQYQDMLVETPILAWYRSEHWLIVDTGGPLSLCCSLLNEVVQMDDWDNLRELHQLIGRALSIPVSL